MLDMSHDNSARACAFTYSCTCRRSLDAVLRCAFLQPWITAFYVLHITAMTGTDARVVGMTDVGTDDLFRIRAACAFHAQRPMQILHRKNWRKLVGRS